MQYLRVFFLFAALAIFFTACTEKREGCLEIEATNFDAAADESCCCCCTYPRLNFTFFPRFDTLVWKPDTAYAYAPGKWFRLKQAIFYLSDFQLQQGGQFIPVSDTLAFPSWGAAGDTVPATLTNDFLLIRRTTVSYTAGTFRPSGVFDAIRFRLGVPEAAQAVIPDLAPEGHALRRQSEGMWMGRDTGFVALRLVFTRDTFSATPPDTLVFSRPDFDNFVIQKDGIFKHESGYNFTLGLTADFREMFRDVDLSSGDKTAWKAQIVANLPNVFRVSQ